MSSGDVSALAAAVVAALAQQAARAAGEELSALGPLLEGVREGVGRLPRWARALERLEGAPGDEAVRGEAVEAVGELLAVDGRLREAVAARWPGVPAVAPGSVTVGASPVSSTSGTRTFHRRAGGILAAVLAAAAALAGLGLYLGRSPGPQPADVPGPGPGASVLSADQVRQVLPDLHAVPAGWALRQEANVVDVADACAKLATADPVCAHGKASGQVKFTTGGDTVTFAVYAFDSPAAADTAYRRFDDLTLPPGEHRAALPALGEAATAVTGKDGVVAMVRAGTTVLEIAYAPQDPAAAWDQGVAAPLARMLTTRSQQAQDGQAPSAVVP